MFGSQPAYPEKLLHKKESLQNQLINIRVELSQATTVTPRSYPLRRATPPSLGFPSPRSPRGHKQAVWGAVGEALKAALQNGSKPPHPVKSPPGSLASFPQATSAPGFVRDKVKSRATYFLGCFNSCAAHPFSLLSGEPGRWQHATLVTSWWAPGGPSNADSSSKSPGKLKPGGRKVSSLQRVDASSSPLVSVTQPGENTRGVGVRSAPFSPSGEDPVFSLFGRAAGWAVAPPLRPRFGCHHCLSPVPSPIPPCPPRRPARPQVPQPRGRTRRGGLALAASQRALRL